MSKITQSKALRCIVKGKKVIGIKHSTPRKEITCTCGLKYLVSVGQIKKCWHNKIGLKSRRKLFHDKNTM